MILILVCERVSKVAGFSLHDRLAAVRHQSAPHSNYALSNECFTSEISKMLQNAVAPDYMWQAWETCPIEMNYLVSLH